MGTWIETVTGPTETVLDLGRAKRFLGIGHPDDDALVGAFLRAVDQLGGRYQGRQLLTATLKLHADGFPRQGRPLGLVGPVQDVAAARYLAAGAWVELTGDDVWLDPAPRREAILPRSDWPLTDAGPGTVEVEYTAGYATRDLVPADTQHGLLLLAAVADWRSPAPLALAALPAGVRLWLDGDRDRRPWDLVDLGLDAESLRSGAG